MLRQPLQCPKCGKGHLRISERVERQGELFVETYNGAVVDAYLPDDCEVSTTSLSQPILSCPECNWRYMLLWADTLTEVVQMFVAEGAKLG